MRKLEQNIMIETGYTKKRNDHNAVVFFKLINTDKDYLNRIDEEVLHLLSNPNLSNKDRRTLSMIPTLVFNFQEALSYKNFNPKEYNGSKPYQPFLYTFIEFLDFKDRFPTIHSIAKKGCDMVKKIHNTRLRPMKTRRKTTNI